MADPSPSFRAISPRMPVSHLEPVTDAAVISEVNASLQRLRLLTPDLLHQRQQKDAAILRMNIRRILQRHLSHQATQILSGIRQFGSFLGL